MDQACQFISSNQDDILLDADSTKTDTYGKQEGAAWIHHYSQTGYHPFVINEYNSKTLVGAWLRPGSTYSADEAEPIMAEVLKRLPDWTAAGRLRIIMFVMPSEPKEQTDLKAYVRMPTTTVPIAKKTALILQLSLFMEKSAIRCPTLQKAEGSALSSISPKKRIRKGRLSFCWSLMFLR